MRIHLLLSTLYATVHKSIDSNTIRYMDQPILAGMQNTNPQRSNLLLRAYKSPSLPPSFTHSLSHSFSFSFNLFNLSNQQLTLINLLIWIKEGFKLKIGWKLSLYLAFLDVSFMMSCN